MAVLLLIPMAAAAQQPPPKSEIPAWLQIEYDCITGDHYADRQECDGTEGQPALPQGWCDQPDIIFDELEVGQRCDDHKNDFWERPFSGDAYFPDDDLLYVLATQDDNWWYFLLQVYGLRDGIKLDANYAIEMDIDPDSVDDYRPSPGQDPEYPDGVGCSDFFHTVFSPTANIVEKVGFDQWGEEGVISYFDADNDLGGCHCAERDDPEKYSFCEDYWSGSGAEKLVDDQQSGGTHPDGLWVMVPSDCESISTEYVDPEALAEFGLPDPGAVNFDGTCVIFAVSKQMVSDYSPGGVLAGALEWRAWANKGEQDNANVELHDKFDAEQAGAAYRDEEFFPPSSAKELDSSAELGNLHRFEPCPSAEEAADELLVFGEFQSFNGAVVPSVDDERPNSVFLSNFVPIERVSRWPSNVLHFIRPVPLVEDADGNLVPDQGAVCADEEEIGCLAWNARTQLLTQAPSPETVNIDRQIGRGPSERRLSYSTGEIDGVPRSIRPFDYPAPAEEDEFDLFRGLGIPFDSADPVSVENARLKAEQIIRETVEIRTATGPSGWPIEYVTGDFFHSEIHLVAGPQRFQYLANDLEGNGRSCTDSAEPNPGYACFFAKHRRRRQVLLGASNDGQVHAFDAGRYRGTVVDGILTGEYTRGTGREVFAHIPRIMLRHTTEMTLTEHDFGADLSLLSDDVFIDPLHDGIPSVADREWRTVVVGGYREGARGYFALDVTQPDKLDEVTVTNLAGQEDTAFIPQFRSESNYVPSCNDLWNASDCGPVPYPVVLWEFGDECVDESSGAVMACDDDGNGFADLGPSWSKPNTGRVRVLVDGQPEVRYVAIFGGGFDRDNPETVGNYLFMLDIETGKLLYKRRLMGAVPAEPAAVDTNDDTLLDTLYLGTTSGILYKVDLSEAAEVDPATGRITDSSQWAPLELFDTGSRAIFFPPEVVLVASINRYALAFGTGDRSDLFSPQPDGRFYMLVDQGFSAETAGLPLTEDDFPQIAATGAEVEGNLLISPEAGELAGWVLQLEPEERLVDNALALSGLLAFSTFVPATDVCGNPTGSGHVYTLLATNANGLRSSGERSRFIEGLAADLFVVPPAGGETVVTEEGVPSPFENEEMAYMREKLMGFFPPGCKFGSYSMQVWALLSDTSQQAVADVPICVLTKNWKEF